MDLEALTMQPDLIQALDSHLPKESNDGVQLIGLLDAHIAGSHSVVRKTATHLGVVIQGGYIDTIWSHEYTAPKAVSGHVDGPRSIGATDEPQNLID